MDDRVPDFFEGEVPVDTLYCSSVGDGDPMRLTFLEVTGRIFMLAAESPSKTSVRWHMVGDGPLAEILEEVHLGGHEVFTGQCIYWPHGAQGFAARSKDCDLVLD